MRRAVMHFVKDDRKKTGGRGPSLRAGSGRFEAGLFRGETVSGTRWRHHSGGRSGSVQGLVAARGLPL